MFSGVLEVIEVGGGPRPLGANVSGVTAAWILNNLDRRAPQAAQNLALNGRGEEARELLQAFRDLKRAVADWQRCTQAETVPISGSGNAEIDCAEIAEDSGVGSSSDGFLSTSEVAVILRLTDRRVRQLIADGSLTGTVRSGRWLVERESVTTYSTLRTSA